jgi:Tol biopolymer transport system component
MKRLIILAPLVGALALGVVGATVAAAPGQQSRFSAWGAPASIESTPGTSSELNTQFLDGCPILSPDGLSLYMASNRPGGVGGLDIWVATRASKSAPFGAPVNVGAPVNSTADDFCPSPMAGGWFLFVSTRPGGCGDADVYVTHRAGQGWWQPLHLGCRVNSAGQEASPYLLTRKDGKVLLYFSSSRAGGFAPEAGAPDHDIYVSPLTVLGFAPAQLVPGLNTAQNDSRPNLRPDGLEIVFDSDRAGTLGGPDVYTATRDKITDPWSTPINLGAPINSPAGESRASLSWDGTSLYFGSTRPGVEGAADIFVATRTRTG